MKTVKFAVLSLVVLVLFSFFLTSCKENVPSISDDLLYGDWEIVEAIRNKKSIKTLKDGTFRFKSDKTMSTNIMGDEAFYPFSLKNGVIDQLDGDMFMLNIEKLSKDSLVLTSIIRNDDFKFTLLPLKEEN